MDARGKATTPASTSRLLLKQPSRARVPSGRSRGDGAAAGRARVGPLRRRKQLAWAGAVAVVVVVLIESVLAQSAAIVPYPRDYKTTLVKYAVVDRSDGFSRDLYASREAIDALKRNPRLQEFPVGALFALDVHTAKRLGQNKKTHAPIWETTREGH